MKELFGFPVQEIDMGPMPEIKVGGPYFELSIPPEVTEFIYARWGLPTREQQIEIVLGQERSFQLVFVKPETHNIIMPVQRNEIRPYLFNLEEPPPLPSVTLELTERVEVKGKLWRLGHRNVEGIDIIAIAPPA